MQEESVVISMNELVDSIFTSSSKMRRRTVCGVEGDRGDQGPREPLTSHQ